MSGEWKMSTTLDLEYVLSFREGRSRIQENIQIDKALSLLKISKQECENYHILEEYPDDHEGVYHVVTRLLEKNVHYILIIFEMANGEMASENYEGALTLYQLISINKLHSCLTDINIILSWNTSWCLMRLGNKEKGMSVYKESVLGSMSNWKCSFEIQKNQIEPIFSKSEDNMKMVQFLGKSSDWDGKIKKYYTPQDVENVSSRLLKTTNSNWERSYIYFVWLHVCVTNERFLLEQDESSRLYPGNFFPRE